MLKHTFKILATAMLLISANGVAQETPQSTTLPIATQETTNLADIATHLESDTAKTVNLTVDTATQIESDSTATDKKKKKKDKNLKFSLLGGPGYSPDYGFTIGISTLTTFKTVKSDTSLMRSVIPIHFSMSFGCPLGFTVLSRPYIYFKEDKIRLQGYYEYKHTNENYYGVGYSLNHNIERNKNVTGYNADLVKINPLLLFKIGKSRSYIGAVADFYYENIKNPGSYVVSDPYYINQGGTVEGMKDINVGLGLAYSYDTRDIAANAYEGMLFEARALYYSKYFGGEYNFGSITVDYRQYHQFSKTRRRALAWNILAKTKIGNPPFSQHADVGGPFNLRGYYIGHYRDNTTITAEVEWRQMWDIDPDTRLKRLLHRLGYTAWVACGFMGENIVKYNAVLPNAGLGFRFEVQKRMNFRVDAGYSFADHHVLFYFNMTEAF